MTEFPADTLAYPEPSKANTASPGLIGRNELKAIDAERRSPEGRRVARIGMIVGMVAAIAQMLVASVFIIALNAGPR